MKTRIITTVAVAGLLAALATSDVFAAGRGKGNGGATGQGSATCTSSSTGNSSATRPVDSQRRDGTFLTTGTTANGSSVRQGKGNGLMDGSRIATTTAPVVSTNP
jgi:hypothetical protein